MFPVDNSASNITSRDTSYSGGNFISGNLYPNLWKFFYDSLHLRSVLDVGAGLGESTFHFRQLGMAPVFAIDAKLSNVAQAKEAVQFHDLSKGPFLIGRVVDLAWDSEVLEHIDEAYLPHLIVTLMQAKVVVANAAQTKFGHHHVTVRSWPKFWEPLFKRAGFVVEKNLTQNILHNPEWAREHNRKHLWMLDPQACQQYGAKKTDLCGHSPGRVLVNTHLSTCSDALSCQQAFINGATMVKGW